MAIVTTEEMMATDAALEQMARRNPKKPPSKDDITRFGIDTNTSQSTYESVSNIFGASVADEISNRLYAYSKKSDEEISTDKFLAKAEADKYRKISKAMAPAYAVSGMDAYSVANQSVEDMAYKIENAPDAAVAALSGYTPGINYDPDKSYASNTDNWGDAGSRLWDKFILYGMSASRDEQIKYLAEKGVTAGHDEQGRLVYFEPKTTSWHTVYEEGFDPSKGMAIGSQIGVEVGASIAAWKVMEKAPGRLKALGAGAIAAEGLLGATSRAVYRTVGFLKDATGIKGASEGAKFYESIEKGGKAFGIASGTVAAETGAGNIFEMGLAEAAGADRTAEDIANRNNDRLFTNAIFGGGQLAGSHAISWLSGPFAQTVNDPVVSAVKLLQEKQTFPKGGGYYLPPSTVNTSTALRYFDGFMSRIPVSAYEYRLWEGKTQKTAQDQMKNGLKALGFEIPKDSVEAALLSDTMIAAVQKKAAIENTIAAHLMNQPSAAVNQPMRASEFNYIDSLNIVTEKNRAVMEEGASLVARMHDYAGSLYKVLPNEENIVPTNKIAETYRQLAKGYNPAIGTQIDTVPIEIMVDKPAVMGRNALGDEVTVTPARAEKVTIRVPSRLKGVTPDALKQRYMQYMEAADLIEKTGVDGRVTPDTIRNWKSQAFDKVPEGAVELTKADESAIAFAVDDALNLVTSKENKDFLIGKGISIPDTFDADIAIANKTWREYKQLFNNSDHVGHLIREMSENPHMRQTLSQDLFSGDNLKNVQWARENLDRGVFEDLAHGALLTKYNPMMNPEEALARFRAEKDMFFAGQQNDFAAFASAFASNKRVLDDYESILEKRVQYSKEISEFERYGATTGTKFLESIAGDAKGQIPQVELYLKMIKGHEKEVEYTAYIKQAVEDSITKGSFVRKKETGVAALDVPFYIDGNKMAAQIDDIGKDKLYRILGKDRTDELYAVATALTKGEKEGMVASLAAGAVVMSAPGAIASMFMDNPIQGAAYGALVVPAMYFGGKHIANSSHSGLIASLMKKGTRRDAGDVYKTLELAKQAYIMNTEQQEKSKQAYEQMKDPRFWDAASAKQKAKQEIWRKDVQSAKERADAAIENTRRLRMGGQ